MSTKLFDPFLLMTFEISNCYDNSVNNIEIEETCYDVNINDFVIIDNITTIKQSQNTNQVDFDIKSSTHTYLFDAHKYIDEILASYNYDTKKILEQVHVDYCRTSIFCNNIFIKTINDFIRHNNSFDSLVFKNECQKSTDNIKEYNFLMILLMLCCQSSYGLHYMSLRDIYCGSTENLLLCSSNENRKTLFTMKDNVLSVSIETNLIIKDTTTNATIKNINTKVIIDSYLDNQNENGHSKFNEYGLFYWNIFD